MVSCPSLRERGGAFFQYLQRGNITGGTRAERRCQGLLDVKLGALLDDMGSMSDDATLAKIYGSEESISRLRRSPRQEVTAEPRSCSDVLYEWIGAVNAVLVAHAPRLH